jgi:hypothetical protein
MKLTMKPETSLDYAWLKQIDQRASGYRLTFKAVELKDQASSWARPCILSSKQASCAPFGVN